MKKNLLIILCLTITGLCFARADSDIQLYNELRQSFSNGFYPGTVSAAEELEKSFSDSSLLPSALVYKGEALVFMENYEEAIEALGKAASLMHSGSPEIIRCNYLMGRSYFAQAKYQPALEKFHLTCKLALTNKDMELYAPAILYSGRAFYQIEKWKEAVPLFEYVAANGKSYESSEYGEALQKLFVCYNKTGSEAKTITLFNKLSEDDFEHPVYMTLCFYYGDACASLNKNKEAYEAYSKVLDGGEKASPRVSAFLLRLAADEFNAKNYEKAEEYLSKIEEPEEGQSQDSDILFIKKLYTAKILLEKEQAKEAEKMLSGLESSAKKSQASGAQESYYSTLLQCKIQNEKWEEIPGLFGKIKTPGSADIFALSSYYYKKGQFEKVDSSCGELYASALCRLGKYEAACAEYKKLSGQKGQAGQTVQSAPFDYALALFRCGRYDEAVKIADAGNAPEKDYLCGLCFINQKAWKKAAERFASYIRQTSGQQNFNKLSLYYKGYAEYNLAEFKNSYSSFVRFCMEENGDGNAVAGDSASYLLRAYEYAVKSALQSGDFKNASVQAANLVRYSPAGEQKQKAVILSAEIFSDYKNYDAAIELLAPYTKGRDNFAAQTIFMTAKLYERQNKIDAADELYRRIYENLSRSEYAEEAMYRSGEVYYSSADYSKAYSRFNSYVYKYSAGRFSDAALFYCADCALRLGENDRSVMLNKTLLQKFPSSVYAYGSNKNLLEAYYKLEEYSQALSVARGMLKNFAKQAADDDIGKRAKELEKIVSGTDRRVAEKESEFASLGGVGTVAGRAAGSALVRLYAESLSTQQEAYELAMKIYARQLSAGLNEERADAAYNAEFIAEYNRRNGNNKKAAEMYLKAAEYYRSVKNENGAAASLYGAAEAFAAEGLKGDARETAALLKELYPRSIQAERVDRVTGDARN